MKPIPEIEAGLESRVDGLGMEVVQLEWSGRSERPILRLRVDFPDAEPGEGVTVGDCARVSRELEAWLDEHPAMPERYVLEVSSPGVERPLTRRKDFERFVGQEARIRKRGGPAGNKTAEAESGEGERGGRTGGSPKSLQGFLEGVEEAEEGYEVLLRLRSGSTARVASAEILEAKLVFRWKDTD